jgi:class 3 adenylate cyclase
MPAMARARTKAETGDTWDVERPPDRPKSSELAPLASDVERDRAIVVLKENYATGSITLEEFAGRMEQALVSRTRNELEVLTKDLPDALPAHISGPPAIRRPAKRPTRWTISIMAGHNRKGRWRIQGSTGVFALMGGAKLDLREADLQPDPDRPGEVEITTISIMGGVEIIVPEGVQVEVEGFSVMGGTDDRTSDPVMPLPGVPIVRVRAFNLMGGVTIRTAKPPKDRRERQHDLGSRIQAKALERAERHVERAARHAAHQLERRARHSGRSSNYWVQHALNEAFGPSLLERIFSPRVQARLRAAGIDPEGLRNSIEAVAGLAASEPMDMKPIAAPDGTVTILFTDIEGSAAITERLGDQRWIEVLRVHNEIVRDQVKANGGSEVRSLGDGFMIVFGSARRALHCAIGIQRAFARYSELHPEEPIRVRIGCHTGEAIREADDFFGRNVVLAARIAEQAKGAEILVSSLVKELTDSGGDVSFGDAREAELNGLTGTRTFYPVVWQ